MQQEELNETYRTLESYYAQTRIPVCVIDSIDGVINTISDIKSRTWTQGLFEYILSRRNKSGVPKTTPFLSYSSYGIFAGIIICDDLYLGVGPVMISNIPLSDFSKTYQGILSARDVMAIYDIAYNAPRMDVGFFANSLSILNKLVNGVFVPYTSIIDANTDFDNNIKRNTEPNADVSYTILSSDIPDKIDSLIEFENNLESAITSGSITNVNKLWEIPEHVLMDGLFSVPNASTYMVVRLITIMNRAALKGGGDEKAVFITTDQYIRRLETTVNSHDRYVMIADASFAFCNLVAAARSYGAFALPVRKCERYIDENLGQKITTADLAILCGVSERQIYRVFKEAFGLSVSEYITRKRLEKSVILLRTTSLSISEISSGCGFLSQSYYTKAFREQYGTTPSAFKSNREFSS